MQTSTPTANAPHRLPVIMGLCCAGFGGGFWVYTQQQQDVDMAAAHAAAIEDNSVAGWSQFVADWPDSEHTVTAKTALWEAQRLQALQHYPMQAITAGLYTIGCTYAQEGRCEDDEHPNHTVRLTQPFWIGETEVTHGLYTEITGEHTDGQALTCPQCPVNHVTWIDAVAFANALSQHHGLPPCYDITNMQVSLPHGLQCGGFRLPTEAEWEIAARGGQELMYSGSPSLESVAWFNDSSGITTSQPVQTKAPNGYGLHDMSGNVWEWTADSYGPYTVDLAEDPLHTGGTLQVVRGGGWNSDSRWLRVTARGGKPTRHRSPSLGFRLVLAGHGP